MNFPFYLAKHFYRGSGKDTSRRRASVPAVRIATAGIALGLAVMLISVGIVRGFKGEINKKLSGFSAHAELVDIRSFSSPEAYSVRPDSLLAASVCRANGVEHIQRFAEKMGVLKTEADFQAVLLKGLSPEYDTSYLQTAIVSGELPNMADSASQNKIVISETQANALNLKVGDRVFAYFFEENVKMRRFTIAALYQTNVKQYDRNIVLVPMQTVQRLNGWTDEEVSGLEIFSDQKEDLNVWTTGLREAVMPFLYGHNDEELAVLSLQENPRTMQVVSWLSLLDMNIWLILALVALVAIFSMSAGLLILILERTSDVGLLRALGSTNTRIRHAFLYYAAFIVLKGLLIGNLLGCGLLWLQSATGIVQLDPSTYYVRVLPVDINVWIILLLNLGTFIITLLALIVPSLLVSRIQPAKAIRFD
ncbi:MAG: ABC transporter permease [Alloprevotella sp.]|nr:ABC transporter permease [Alloprevotella sp.]